MPTFFSDDIAIYHAYAENMLSGQIPYRDFVPEYPPLALLFFLLPKLLVRDPGYYSLAFQVQLVLCALGGLALVLNLRRTLTAGLIYTCGLLALLTLTFGRYDVIPAVMAFGAVSCFLQGQRRSAYVILALAALTKVYPLVLLPVFLAKEHDLRQGIRHTVALLATGLAGTLPFLLLSPSGFFAFVVYQGAREVHIESAANLLFLPLHWLFDYPLEVVYGHQSYGVTMPGEVFWRLGQTLLLAGVPFIAYWRARCSGPATIMEDALFALTAFLLANRVFSPQFLIWVVPFLPFVAPSISIAIIALNLLTEWFFQRYDRVIDLALVESFMVWLRNLGLLILWIVLLRWTDHGRRWQYWMTETTQLAEPVKLER